MEEPRLVGADVTTTTMAMAVTTAAEIEPADAPGGYIEETVFSVVLPVPPAETGGKKETGGVQVTKLVPRRRFDKLQVVRGRRSRTKASRRSLADANARDGQLKRPSVTPHKRGDISCKPARRPLTCQAGLSGSKEGKRNQFEEWTKSVYPAALWKKSGIIMFVKSELS